MSAESKRLLTVKQVAEKYGPEGEPLSVADLYRFAHLTRLARLAQVLGVNVCPAFMWYSALSPFSRPATRFFCDRVLARRADEPFAGPVDWPPRRP